MQLSALIHPSDESIRVSTDSDAEEALSFDLQPLLLTSDPIDGSNQYA